MIFTPCFVKDVSFFRFLIEDVSEPASLLFQSEWDCGEALFLVFPRAMSTTRRRFIASSLLEAVPERRDRERQKPRRQAAGHS